MSRLLFFDRRINERWCPVCQTQQQTPEDIMACVVCQSMHCRTTCKHEDCTEDPFTEEES